MDVTAMRLAPFKGLSPSVVIFLFFFSIYSFTMAGMIQYGDEVEKYRVAQSIVDRHDFSFRPTAQRNVTGVGGQTYSIYELGQTVFQVPLYALGRVLYSFFPLPDVNWITQLTVGLLNPILTALSCVVLYLTCASLGPTRRVSLALTLIFGLGTIAWPYSKGFTREPLLALLLLSSFYAVHRFQKTNHRRWVLIAGIASGYLVFSKFIHAIVVPFFLAYILIIIFKRHRGDTRESRRGLFLTALQALVLFSVPAILFMLMQSVYALARFGSPLSGIAGTKYNPLDWIMLILKDGNPSQAIPGLLFSSEKSIFLYSPPILISLIAWFKWVKVQTQEALLCLALVVVEFASAFVRPDWDGGTWWGPRYLVQITPLLIIPLGALESFKRATRRFWKAILVMLAGVGIIIQLAGAFSNSRDYLDTIAIGITLVGQIDFLFHGAFDSLLIYLAPTGFPIQINPYGIVLILIIGGLGLLLLLRIQRNDIYASDSRLASVGFLSLVLVIELVGFITWVAAPYAQILANQGNTRLVAGNRFLADGRTREAAGMYLMALDRGTNYPRDALARLDELLPRVQGDALTTNELLNQREGAEIATIEPDNSASLSGGAVLKIEIPGEKDATASALSDWITVQPNTSYELSGWIRTTNVYGSGYAVVTFYEDNGIWKNPRKMDVITLDETSGWRPFRRTITTLSTTRRVMISTGLWQTFGTVWVESIQLAKVTNQ